MSAEQGGMRYARALLFAMRERAHRAPHVRGYYDMGVPVGVFCFCSHALCVTVGKNNSDFAPSSVCVCGVCL